jgi:hypothetical protein
LLILLAMKMLRQIYFFLASILFLVSQESVAQTKPKISTEKTSNEKINVEKTNAEKTNVEVAPKPTQPVKPAKTVGMSMEDFAKLFPSETKPMPFAVGKLWLQKKPQNTALDAAVVRQYIANNKIWINNLQKDIIPTSANFYPVAQVALHSNFYSFLVADSQGDVINVYLLNYTKEGKFSDGVCAISVRPPAEGYSRNTILTDGKMIMVKEAKQGTAKLFTFDVWDIGNLHGRL